MSKPISEFEIIDLGMDASQYFPGLSSGKFDNKVIGQGDNPKEAFDDALEQIAEMDFDVKELEKEKFEDNPSVSDEFEDSEDWYYYIGVRFNE